MIKIKSLQELKNWNNKPTEEKPVLMEWFLDWFFEELLEKDDFEKAKEAREEFIKFTEICEDMNKTEAINRVDGNLQYYSGYSITKWQPKLAQFFNHTILTN